MGLWRGKGRRDFPSSPPSPPRPHHRAEPSAMFAGLPAPSPPEEGLREERELLCLPRLRPQKRLLFSLSLFFLTSFHFIILFV